MNESIAKKLVFVLALLALTFKAGGQDETSPDLVGHKLMELGHYAEAAEHYKSVFEGDPSNVKACVGLGMAHCKLRDYAQSTRWFESCAERFPERPEPLIARGICEQGRGGDHASVARADFMKALEMEPDNPTAHNQLGLIYQSKGDHDAAMAEFNAAIKSDPDFAVSYNNLAASMIARGEYQEAIATLQKTAQLDSTLPGLYHNLGVAFLAAGKRDHAEAAFLMETALNPDNLKAHTNLGNIYALNGRYADAEYEYKRVLTADPEDAETMVNLGTLYVLTARYQEAIEVLRAALDKKPDNALAHHYLAVAYRATGFVTRAERHEKIAREMGYREVGEEPK